MSAPEKPTIVIVEDHSDTRQYLANMLRAEGFPVVSLPNRDAAAKYIETGRFDIILLDYFMLGMPAHKFVTLAKQRNPGVRIIMISDPSYGKTAAMLLGLTEVLFKPITAEALLFLLHK